MGTCQCTVNIIKLVEYFIRIIMKNTILCVFIFCSVSCSAFDFGEILDFGSDLIDGVKSTIGKAACLAFDTAYDELKDNAEEKGASIDGLTCIANVTLDSAACGTFDNGIDVAKIAAVQGGAIVFNNGTCSGACMKKAAIGVLLVVSSASLLF